VLVAIRWQTFVVPLSFGPCSASFIPLSRRPHFLNSSLLTCFLAPSLHCPGWQRGPLSVRSELTTHHSRGNQELAAELSPARHSLKPATFAGFSLTLFYLNSVSMETTFNRGLFPKAPYVRILSTSKLTYAVLKLV